MMERLTYDFCVSGKHCWQVKGADNSLCKDVCREQGDNGCEDCPIKKAIDRLAAYEDTGLEPERVEELAQAEKDGRLISHLPGEKVFDRFGTPWIIESSEIHLIQGKLKQLFRCGYPGAEDYCAMYDDEILTREEAELALKKKEEADNETD